MSLLTLPKPDVAILGRRDDIIRQLKKLAPNASLIVDEEGRRTFESDALTAYRCMPLVVILPDSTEDVSKVLRFCHDNKIKVVPRGAGTSLSGGALPLEDAIVLGISRMTLSAKTGVSLTQNRNPFSEIAASVTSVSAIAVALRGVFSISDISPKMPLASTV